jgi:DNA-directed RNA polymerase subunit RPC12/RpoP
MSKGQIPSLVSNQLTTLIDGDSPSPYFGKCSTCGAVYGIMEHRTVAYACGNCKGIVTMHKEESPTGKKLKAEIEAYYANKD